MSSKASSNSPFLLLSMLIAAFLLLWVAVKLPQQEVEVSRPVIGYLGTTYTVEFNVANHGKRRVHTTVRVSVGNALNGKGVPGPREVDYQIVAVSVPAGESKHVRCEFPNTLNFTPHVAQAIVLK